MGFLFWMFVVWFVASRIARRRHRRYRGMWMAGPGVWWMMTDGQHRQPRGLYWGNMPAPAPPQPRELTPREKSERAMADLRRRYVADEISVEEYEAGLDRILRS
jgi:hypothetical protein